MQLEAGTRGRSGNRTGRNRRSGRLNLTGAVIEL